MGYVLLSRVPAAALTRRISPRSVKTRSLFTFPNLQSEPQIQRFHETKELPYTSEQLYDVVSDVGSYPSFLPFCTDCRVIRRLDKGRLDAEMTVGYGPFTESYVSNVTCIPHQSVKAVASESTPLFKSLESTWRFHPTRSRGSTRVTLDLAYAFANPVYANVAAGVFGQMSQLMVKAFEDRCRHLYG